MEVELKPVKPMVQPQEVLEYMENMFPEVTDTERVEKLQKWADEFNCKIKEK